MRKSVSLMPLAFVLPVTVLFSMSILLSPFATAGTQEPGDATFSAQTTSTAGAAQPCRVPWQGGTYMNSVKLIYNSQNDEFLAWAVKNLTTPILGGGEGTSHADQTIAALRLSPSGGASSSPLQLLPDMVVLPNPPVLAHNTATNRYLTVYNWAGRISLTQLSDPQLRGRLWNADLTPAGDLIRFDQPHEAYWPAVAYNPDDDEFLLMWYDENGASRSYMGPTLTPEPSGTPQATPTPTSGPTTTTTPTGPRNYRAIYARRLNSDGTEAEEWGLLHEPGVERGQVRNLKMHYNPQAKEYVLVWEQHGEMPGLYMLRLSRARQRTGPATRIVGPPAVPYDPALVYNSTANQYLVAWADARGGPGQFSDVYGVILSAQGQPQAEPFVIRGTAQHELPTDAVYNPVRNEYLVAWDTKLNGEGVTTDTEIKTSLQRLSPQGMPIGDPIQTTGGVFGVGVNTETGNYLALEQFGFTPKYLDDQVPCVPTATPTVAVTPTRTLGHPQFTPIPTPYVFQVHGRVYEVPRPAGAGAVQYTVAWEEKGARVGDPIVFPHLVQPDEHFYPLKQGSEVWVTVHEEIWTVDRDYGALLTHNAEHVVVVGPAATLTPTPAGSSSATPTTTSTPSPTDTAGPTPTLPATITGTPPTQTATVQPTNTATATASPTATATSETQRHDLYLPYLAQKQDASTTP